MQCENELKYWDGVGPGRPAPEPAPAQLEAVLTEVRRLEEAAARNEEELTTAAGNLDTEAGAGPGIRGELDQLKHRLGGYSWGWGWSQAFLATSCCPQLGKICCNVIFVFCGFLSIFALKSKTFPLSVVGANKNRQC